MITFTELFILNRFLDEKDVPRIPSFRKIRGNIKLIKDSEYSLIEKGFLKNHDELTEKGVLLVKRLELYKNTERFIHVQGVWIALCREKYGIILKMVNEDQYKIYIIRLEKLLEYLEKTYTFLSAKDQNHISTETEMDHIDLYNKYCSDSTDWFLVESIKKGFKETTCLFFEFNGKKFRYDNQTKNLVSVTNKMIVQEISRLYVMEA